MENSYLKEIALRNYNFAFMPETVEKLTKHIQYLLMDKLHITVILSGSFQSHTTVKGYSDIDMLAVTNYDSTADINPKAYILSLVDALMDGFPYLDVDVEYDPPAVCVTHLSEPDYPIEITPAIRSTDFGIFLGRETCDYFILNNDFTSWVATNPLLQRRVTDYLNEQTSNGFSYLCSLLKLWKRTYGIPMLSFGIEVFLYHWLRGTFADASEFGREHLGGTINLSFPCKPLGDTLEESLIAVMEDLYGYLEKSNQENRVFGTTNPYVRMDMSGERVCLFSDCEEQKKGTEELKRAISLVKAQKWGGENYDRI